MPGLDYVSKVFLVALPLLAMSAPVRACSRGWIVFFQHGAASIDETTIAGERGAQVLREYVRCFEMRRPRTEAERGVSCGPLEPIDWRFVLTAHAQDRHAKDQCALSRERGRTVRERLARLGLPEDRIVILAYGDHQPLTPPAEDEHPPVNRRVELHFVEAEKTGSLLRQRDLCPE